MLRTRLLATGLVYAFAELWAQGPQPAVSNADGCRIIAVSPAGPLEVRERQPIRFEVTLHYSLQSADIAVLQVYAERFADDLGACNEAANHRTEAIKTARIKRGDGDLKVEFSWPDSIGPTAQNPWHDGALAFGANFWTDKDGNPVKPRLRAFGTSFCRPVKL